MLIGVITSSCVVWIIFVASKAPPSPVSRTTISQFFSLKYKKARAVSISKAVGIPAFFSFISATASAIAVTCRAKASFSIISSFT